ncbi:MAG: hypothetical protein WB974_05755, partial [Acidobacteriaceae bacterium]
MTHALRAAILLALLSPLVYAATPAASRQNDAVLAPVQALFDGMTHRDAATIRAPLLPGGSMVLMRD